MNTKITLAIIAAAATSLITLGTTGSITVDTAVAQNATAGATNATDSSNMTTFEENMTAAGVDPAAGGMTNLTG